MATRVQKKTHVLINTHFNPSCSKVVGWGLYELRNKLILLAITRIIAKRQSTDNSVHYVAKGLFITLHHPACTVLMFSSVLRYTGSLLTLLRHHACAVLWYLPSMYEVANWCCSCCCKTLWWFIIVFNTYPCHCQGLNRNQFILFPMLYGAY